MIQNKLIPKQTSSFESRNLIVDYITFKFPDLKDFDRERIAEYLFQLGFNSYQESGKLVKPTKEPILVNFKNQFEVCFVRDNPYWKGDLLHFSGFNARKFYNLIKNKSVSWELFSDSVLHRLSVF